MSSGKEIFRIIDELDKEQSIATQPLQTFSNFSVFERLRKTQAALNEEAAAAVFDRFGVKGINLDNLEQLYNPLNSGFGQLHQARSHLLQRGMTPQLADHLAKRYIAKLESLQVFPLMELFDSSKSPAALTALVQAGSLSEVHLAYESWDQFL